MSVVQPDAHELLARRRLRLGDFVLVVREDQVDPAGVDVERLAQLLHAHGRAFDVPARPAGTYLRLPRRFTWLGALPQREVAHVVLAVVVGGDALCLAGCARLEPRQRAVGGPG